MLEINGLNKATIRRLSKDSQPVGSEPPIYGDFTLTHRSGITRNPLNFRCLREPYPVLEVALFFHFKEAAEDPQPRYSRVVVTLP